MSTHVKQHVDASCCDARRGGVHRDAAIVHIAPALRRGGAAIRALGQ
jgi:hypothetical protein